jgi:hypothetical protein
MMTAVHETEAKAGATVRQLSPGIRCFINLSAGIEVLARPMYADMEFDFIRISSTDCEHKLGNPQWEAILGELDTNLLMALARGHHCLIYDCSKTGELSHALSHGVAWVRWVLEFAWFHRVLRPALVDGEDWSGFFRTQWASLSSRTRRRILLFRHFLEPNVTDVFLEIRCLMGEHDGDWEYYKRLLRSVGR